jgi:hypothetical protein
MRILITGGNGMIGRRLCAVFSARGDDITVLSRRPSQVKQLCGSSVQAMSSLDEWNTDQCFDLVVNLAGEPIIDVAWSPERKQAIWESRVGLTKVLVKKIAAAKQKPQVLLSGSAIGYYGSMEQQDVNESHAAGTDFSAKLCSDWEEAALAARESGVRVCLLRTGLVLDEKGGILKKMLLPFKFALGSRLGDGRQWMSWIHYKDFLGAVLYLLENTSTTGAFNMTAPRPVSNAQFTKDLAHAVGKPAIFVAPAFVLRAVLGGRSELLLGGQHVVPKKLVDTGSL